MGDIIIWGATQEEHDERLRQVLDIARKVNLKLNRDKCQCSVSELILLGDKITSAGIKPDPRKTQAIENMDKPKCRKDIQMFLGMINFLGKFIPNLSSKCANLRSLIEKKNQFVWGPEHEKEWSNLKKVICNEPVLKFYDHRKPIKVSSDASQNGLGAVLLQQQGNNTWLPVAFASRSLTDSEMRYCQ